MSSDANDDLQRELDQLGERFAPKPEFAARVMDHVHRLPAHGSRRIGKARWIAAGIAALAACILVAVGVNRSSRDLRAPQAVVPPIERKTQVGYYTVSVVLDRDVPVRQVVYRQFDRVEQIDPDGKVRRQVNVPTKVMLVSTREQY